MENLSPRYKTFLGFIALIFVCNLFVLNDMLQPYFYSEKITLGSLGWMVELPLTPISLFRDGGNNFINIPLLSYYGIDKIFPESLFAIRSMGILFLLGSLYVSYFLGKKMFGKSRMLLTTLVVMTSLLVVNISKFAMVDSWILGIQMGLFFSLILYLKQPSTKWRNWHFGFLLLGVLVAPIQNLVFGVGLWVYLYWMHPKGKGLIQIKPWFAWIPLILISFIFKPYYNIALGTPLPSFAWQTPSGFLVLTGFGLLLFWAFLFPALWSLVTRLRKREEFSILLFGGLLFGMLTLSLSVQYFMAILVAKQINDYFNKNYPYESVVKGIAVLTMIAAFCVAMYHMLDAFQVYGNAGFRSMMLLSMAFWIPNFIFIIGLYGKNRKMVEGGLLTAGVLVTFMFWIHVAPLVLSDWFFR